RPGCAAAAAHRATAGPMRIPGVAIVAGSCCQAPHAQAARPDAPGRDCNSAHNECRAVGFPGPGGLCRSEMAFFGTGASVPIPKLVRICGTRGTNFGIERTLANL